LPALAEDRENLPEMAIGIYDWAYVADHQERRSWLVSSDRDERTAACWDELVLRFSAPIGERFRTPFRLSTGVTSNLSFEQYSRAYNRIQSYIRAGD
jgi:para-aminobenzoate synthetase component I